MVRNNYVIPNGHFHKNWQIYVKTWFNQPMKKKRRASKRKEKIKGKLPQPQEVLRPMVHCPTFRYNSKIKPGRGFTLTELKKAGLNKRFARTIGISVDTRRFNKSVEGQQSNVQRLKEYYSKLVLFPLNKKKQKIEMKEPIRTVVKGLNDMVSINKYVNWKVNKARVITEEERKFSPYLILKKARADAKYCGIRLVRKRMKDEGFDPSMKKVRLPQQEMDV